MKLFTIIVITTCISLVCDQTPITTEARKLKKTFGQEHPKASSTDVFVPTSQENTLRVEHKKGNANVERFQDDFKPTKGRNLQKTNGQDYFKTGFTDDFAPTAPGNSPGMGHKKGNANIQGFKDNFQPTEDRKLQNTNSQNHFKAGFTDDFAPTTPGNSPGMGHKKGDDFKPTIPGHSPGVGHAIKNDEPKA